MRNGVLCCLLGCASLLSCTTYMPSIAPDQRLTGKEAIVYGRFQVEGPFTPDVAHSSLALVMRCQDSREYRIRFDDAEPVVALATAPSTCWLDEVLYLDADNNPLGRTTLPDHVRRATRLDAGRAYYLGDFNASIRYEFSGGIDENFQVKDWRNNFTATTQDFQERFPNLRSLVPVDPLRAGATARRTTRDWARAWVWVRNGSLPLNWPLGERFLITGPPLRAPIKDALPSERGSRLRWAAGGTGVVVR